MFFDLTARDRPVGFSQTVCIMVSPVLQTTFRQQRIRMMVHMSGYFMFLHYNIFYMEVCICPFEFPNQKKHVPDISLYRSPDLELGVCVTAVCASAYHAGNSEYSC